MFLLGQINQSLSLEIRDSPNIFLRFKQMTNFADNENVYDVRWIRQLLTEHYPQHISFIENAGQETIICFKDMASFIINIKYKEKKMTYKKKHPE